MIATHTEIGVEQLIARQVVAYALASALSDPRSRLAQRAAGADLGLIAHSWAIAACEADALEPTSLGLGERVPRDVSAQPLAHWLALPPSRREQIHQRIFGLVVTKLCPSYEIEYCEWKDTTHRSQEMADIAGFYNAFGVVPSRSSPERFDHVSLEIEFIALLIEKERIALEHDELEHAEICRDARAAFLRDHAGWWMPTFGRLLEKRANMLAAQDESTVSELHIVAGVAQVLCAWIAAERHFAAVTPSRRIISPNIAPQDATDDCGTCESCSVAGPSDSSERPS
jgi:nitrate reductase assembly molybdenum cofactor insertion protein NarJ